MTLRRSDIDFILTLHKKGVTTRKNHNDFGLLTFYVKTARLRDMKLIENDGVEPSGRKRWRLTDNGIEISNHLVAIEEILKKIRGEDNEGEGVTA